MEIKERGWPGHFIAAFYCRYKRNTQISDGGRVVVVSSVGNYHSVLNKSGLPEEIGYQRYYETMVFRGKVDGCYVETDVTHELNCAADVPFGIYGNSPRELPEDVDNIMDAQHDAIVSYVSSHFDEVYEGIAQ